MPCLMAAAAESLRTSCLIKMNQNSHRLHTEVCALQWHWTKRKICVCARTTQAVVWQARACAKIHALTDLTYLYGFSRRRNVLHCLEATRNCPGNSSLAPDTVTGATHALQKHTSQTLAKLTHAPLNHKPYQQSMRCMLAVSTCFPVASTWSRSSHHVGRKCAAMMRNQGLHLRPLAGFIMAASSARVT